MLNRLHVFNKRWRSLHVQVKYRKTPTLIWRKWRISQVHLWAKLPAVQVTKNIWVSNVINTKDAAICQRLTSTPPLRFPNSSQSSMTFVWAFSSYCAPCKFFFSNFIFFGVSSAGIQGGPSPSQYDSWQLERIADWQVRKPHAANAFRKGTKSTHVSSGGPLCSDNLLLCW